VTQSGVEVVQDPELSKNDRPLWVAVEAFDLAVFEFEHLAARGGLPVAGSSPKGSCSGPFEITVAALSDREKVTHRWST
jgi:hypothetical protein